MLLAYPRAPRCPTEVSTADRPAVAPLPALGFRGVPPRARRDQRLLVLLLPPHPLQPSSPTMLLMLPLWTLSLVGFCVLHLRRHAGSADGAVAVATASIAAIDPADAAGAASVDTVVGGLVCVCVLLLSLVCAPTSASHPATGR